VTETSDENGLPDSFFRLRYRPDLPAFPIAGSPIHHVETIRFLQGLMPKDGDLTALTKLQRYTAIETNRIEGQLAQLGQDDTYTKIILLHGITPAVIYLGDIPDPQFVACVLSDTADASDTCMEIVQQHSPITKELLLAVHARLLRHSRVGLAMGPNSKLVLVAIQTNRFKLIPNNPVVKSAYPNVPPLIHQYCPPALVEDHMAKFMEHAAVGVISSLLREITIPMSGLLQRYDLGPISYSSLVALCFRGHSSIPSQCLWILLLHLHC
jgi:hypothetical protein